MATDLSKLTDEQLEAIVKGGNAAPPAATFHPTHHADSLKGTRDLGATNKDGSDLYPPQFPGMAAAGENPGDFRSGVAGLGDMASVLATATLPATTIAPMAGLASKMIPRGMGDGIKGAIGAGYQAVKDIPFAGKIARIPEAMAKGYQEGVSPTPQAPAPFRPNPNIASRMQSRSTPGTDPSAAPLSRPMAGRQASPAGLGPRKVEVQHLGDMRINGRTPEPPKLFDRFGRVISP